MLVQYQRSSSVDAAPMQGETILFNPQTNTFCVLNAAAAVVWEGLATPQGADGLAARLCQAFSGVTEEQARRDVEGTLQELAALSLIVAEQ